MSRDAATDCTLNIYGLMLLLVLWAYVVLDFPGSHSEMRYTDKSKELVCINESLFPLFSNYFSSVLEGLSKLVQQLIASGCYSVAAVFYV